MCDYKNACIFVKGAVDVLATAKNKNDKTEKETQFKNNAPVRSFVSKNNNSLIDNAEDLNLVMPMHSLLE